ncbi:MAG: ABC transporter permease subunit [Planctomycetaceae bacterium]|jgi:sodium transport system permease protein|nr:ABC transporter permease subunit [Planctomycetaceae bacterium]
MDFRNIFLLLKREIRDQLRDRRMLFMIFVLPLLLYPAMGIFMIQTGQNINQKSSKITVYVTADFKEAIQEDRIFPLFELDENSSLTAHFNQSLFSKREPQHLLELEFVTIPDSDRHGSSPILSPSEELPESLLPSEPPFEQRATEQAKIAIDARKCDAALVIPASFLEKLRKIYDEIRPRRRSANPQWATEQNSIALNQSSEENPSLPSHPDIPQPNVIYSTATQKSLIAKSRLEEVLDSWNRRLGAENIKKGGLSPEVASPIHVESSDIAARTSFQGASVWSKSLPILLLLWALTGAFYPAIDLCAGEKERGTLETLLSSPASRIEIVMSKLLTVMTFSVLTSFLNILCIAATGYFLISKIAGVGIPPVWTPLWLLIALIPTAALFSAVCIALAVYARSSKEGQYYLTPVILIVMPLVLLPMMSGHELNLGTAIIPVSGIVQVLGALLEGDYKMAFTFLPVVTLVTLGCCIVAIRWSVDQFNSESVLFRESERFHLILWLKKLFRTRFPTPTPQAAIFCGMLILSGKYFLSFISEDLAKPEFFVMNILISQFLGILFPAAVLTAISSSSLSKTLRVSFPNPAVFPIILLLAFCWHPVIVWLQSWVLYIYPVAPEVEAAFQSLDSGMSRFSPWISFLLIAVLPGFCEEITFRGYMFSGLNTPGHHLRAIVVTAIFFGAVHPILQQSILATITGCLLGWITFQTGSIWPTILFHVTNNGITVLVPNLEEIVKSPDSVFYGHWGISAALVIFVLLLMILGTKRFQKLQ